MVIVPLLVLAFGVDLPDAVGTSLIAVIATSSGAAAAYVREGYSNIRIGMVLEVATTIGAIAGALLALVIAPGIISIIFGVALLISAYLSARQRPPDARPTQSDRLAEYLRLRGSFPTPEGPRAYHVVGLPLGFALMWVAGVLSGMLGIGSGAFKVLAMDQVMKLPFKVSTTTSNFMIGVTAAASAGVYLQSRLHRPGAGAAGRARSAGGLGAGDAHPGRRPGAGAADRLRGAGAGHRRRDDLQGNPRRVLTCCSLARV